MEDTEPCGFGVSGSGWMMVAPLTNMGYIERVVLAGKPIHSVSNMLYFKSICRTSWALAINDIFHIKKITWVCWYK